MIVSTQFQQSGMKMNLVTATLQYGTAQIVVQNHPRGTRPGGKGMDVAAQEVLQSLIKEKFQVQSPGVRQGDNEAGEAPAGTTHANFTEMSPVHLRFFRRKFMQSQKGFPVEGAQGGHHTT